MQLTGGMMARPKFSGHVHSTFCCESKARGRCATTGMKSDLRHYACRSMSRQASDSRTFLPALSVVGNDSAPQRIQEPGTDTSLVRGMIAKIFVEGRRDHVLDGRFYRVGCETCA